MAFCNIWTVHVKPVVILSLNAVFQKLKNLDCRRAAALFREPPPGGSRGPAIPVPTGSCSVSHAQTTVRLFCVGDPSELTAGGRSVSAAGHQSAVRHRPASQLLLWPPQRWHHVRRSGVKWIIKAPREGSRVYFWNDIVTVLCKNLLVGVYLSNLFSKKHVLFFFFSLGKKFNTLKEKRLKWVKGVTRDGIQLAWSEGMHH